jgi:integrase
LALAKQAKILSARQTALLRAFLQHTRYPDRNQVILLLSVKAGLRAKEIAALTWDMLTDAENNLGQAIHLRNEATKGASGRVIPLNRKLRQALAALFAQRGSTPFVITTERSERTSAAAIANLFACWYRKVGFNGCSSHSGRRTFITNAARKISTVGGTIATSKRTLRRKGRSWISFEFNARRQPVRLLLADVSAIGVIARNMKRALLIQCSTKSGLVRSAFAASPNR